MYVFMVSGLSLLMFIVHYVYTTTVRKVSNNGTMGRRLLIFSHLEHPF